MVAKHPYLANEYGMPHSTALELVREDHEMQKWQPSEADLDDIIETLSTYSESVRKNLTIVSRDEARAPYLLHVTPEKKPKYIPRIGTKQNPTEDRTVTRITAADTLLGCIIGYAVLWNDVTEYTGKDLKKGSFLNGLYIQKISFEYMLRPTKKLVFDRDASNEHWLVSYNKDTTEYPSEQIGKFLVEKIELLPSKDTATTDVYHILVETSEPIWLSSDIILSNGHHRVKFSLTRKTHWAAKKGIEVERIEQSDFKAAKDRIAAMLSIENKGIRTW
jgi:hypothetical protein